MMLLTWACSNRPAAIEGALYSCDSYTVWPDSFVSHNITVAPQSLSVPPGLEMTLECGDTLLTYLFNTPDTISDSRLADPLIDPVSAIRQAHRLLDTIDTLSVSGYRWPVVNCQSNVAASVVDIVRVTGDKDLDRRLRELASSILHEDCRWLRDPRTGLFRGASPDLISLNVFPYSVNAADIAATISYSDNLDHIILLDYLSASQYDSYSSGRHDQSDRYGITAEQYAAMRDTVADAIDTYLWLPDKGFYAAMLYGQPFATSLHAADIAAQARGVNFGVTHEAIATAMIAKTPVDADAIRAIYPSPASQHRPDPMTSAQWAIAAARTGNRSAFNTSLAMTIASLFDSAATGFSPLKSIILRGMAGIDTSSADELRFAPYITPEMSGQLEISGLKYRNAIIDITINGHGNIISTFALDERVQSTPTLKSTLTGRHHVSITLVGSDDATDNVNIQPMATLAPPPALTWSDDGRTATISGQNISATLLYLNGQLIEQMSQSTYTLPVQSPTTVVTMVSVANEQPGYAAPTHLYAPHTISVRYTDIARPYARSLRDKRLAHTYVESTRYRNRTLTASVSVDSPGQYYLTIGYLNGEGIVNPDRRYALRSLRVNDDKGRLIVFAQLTPDDWRHDRDWQSSTGLTPPVRVSLVKGDNKIALEYFSTDEATFNHDTNTLIPISLNLIPID